MKQKETGNFKSLKVHSSLLWSYCGFSLFVNKEWKRSRGRRIKLVCLQRSWNFLHLSTTTITGLVVPARPQALAPGIDESTLMGAFSNFYPTLHHFVCLCSFGLGLHYPTCRQGANASFLPYPSKPPSQRCSWTPVQRQEPDILEVIKLYFVWLWTGFNVLLNRMNFVGTCSLW